MATTLRARFVSTGIRSAYRDDLAAIHDLGFGAIAEHAATLLVRELNQREARGGLVVELGCGSGRSAERMAAAGYEVLGVDLSERLVERARRRVPEGSFAVGSWIDFEIPRCAAVIAAGECFNYLFDPRNTASARLALMRRVYHALEPEGLWLFDAAGPGRVVAPARGDAGLRTQVVHSRGDGWDVVMKAEEDPRRRILTRTITTFRRLGRHYRRDEEVHRLRLLPREVLLAKLRGVGFRVRALRGYGTLRFPSGLTGFLARRGARRGRVVV